MTYRLVIRTSILVALGAVTLTVVRELLGQQLQRSLFTDVFQGTVGGAALGLLTSQIYARIKRTKINGWTTMFGLGRPGNGLLFRAACAQLFPGPVTVPEEAMYWTTGEDGTGRRLDGRRAYVMHFPPGGLPPNDAFWSLTMSDANDRFVPNPIDRYHVGGPSGLDTNSDGSVDIYMQRTPPAAHASNWLPAPTGHFILWLRVYMPGPAILDRRYEVPPIVEARRS